MTPVSVGVKLENSEAIGQHYRDFQGILTAERKPLESPYRGVQIYKGYAVTPLFDALIDDYWHFSPSEAAIKSQIDRAQARREKKT